MNPVTNYTTGLRLAKLYMFQAEEAIKKNDTAKAVKNLIGAVKAYAVVTNNLSQIAFKWKRPKSKTAPAKRKLKIEATVRALRATLPDAIPGIEEKTEL
jgi:hypothetical protein